MFVEYLGYPRDGGSARAGYAWSFCGRTAHDRVRTSERAENDGFLDGCSNLLRFAPLGQMGEFRVMIVNFEATLSPTGGLTIPFQDQIII
jgi:hypothetical protein